MNGIFFSTTSLSLHILIVNFRSIVDYILDHAVCHSGSILEARLAIFLGADANARDNYYGEPLLRSAIKKGMFEMVELLIDSGADPETRSNFGHPAIFDAVSHSLKMTNLLLEKGAKIKAREYDGCPLLLHAVMCESEETVKFFLDKGADPNECDRDGVTPIMAAVRGKSIAIPELLLKRGADIKARDKNGLDVYTFAAEKVSWSNDWCTDNLLWVCIKCPEFEQRLLSNERFVRFLCERL